jgi:hypothetical protein
MTISAMNNELRERRAPHRAQLGALREMLADRSAGENQQLDNTLAGRMRDTVAEILRIQQVLSRLDD